MKTLQMAYGEFNREVLEKIMQLADQLEVPPKVATRRYLLWEARRQTKNASGRPGSPAHDGGIQTIRQESLE